MPRNLKIKAPPKTVSESSYDDNDEDFDLDADGEEEFAMLESENHPSGIKVRDWRDIERYREERELRSMVEDDLDLDLDLGGDINEAFQAHH